MQTARSLIVLSLVATFFASPGRGETRDPNPSANDPDRFAWEVFVDVNRPAHEAGNTVFWETWAAQGYIYDDPCKTPVWPGETVLPRELRGSGLLRLINRQHAFETSGFDSTNQEETRLNRAAFDYIVSHQLWYQEGVLKAAARDGIDFPSQSIVIKANWAPISEQDKARYHWTVDKGQLYGLNAFHLIDKSLPRWLWSTFEHKSNAGRCDYIGCKDRFGVEPGYVAPHVEPGLEYEPGRLTPALEKMIDAAGLDPVFKNYRLKGTMIDFTDALGRPEILGSSVLEPGFESTSSCMTCHTRASVSDNTAGLSSSLAAVASLQPLEGFVGAPDPGWFFVDAGGLPVRSAPIVYRTDFLWEFTDAQSRSGCGQSQ